MLKMKKLNKLTLKVVDLNKLDSLTNNDLKNLRGGQWVTTGYHGVVLNSDGSVKHTFTLNSASSAAKNTMDSWVGFWRAAGYGCNYITLGYDDGEWEEEEEDIYYPYTV